VRGAGRGVTRFQKSEKQEHQANQQQDVDRRADVHDGDANQPREEQYSARYQHVASGSLAWATGVERRTQGGLFGKANTRGRTLARKSGTNILLVCEDHEDGGPTTLDYLQQWTRCTL
jgi:hypothetical protein